MLGGKGPSRTDLQAVVAADTRDGRVTRKTRLDHETTRKTRDPGRTPGFCRVLREAGGRCLGEGEAGVFGERLSWTTCADLVDRGAEGAFAALPCRRCSPAHHGPAVGDGCSQHGAHERADEAGGGLAGPSAREHPGEATAVGCREIATGKRANCRGAFLGRADGDEIGGR